MISLGEAHASSRDTAIHDLLIAVQSANGHSEGLVLDGLAKAIADRMNEQTFFVAHASPGALTTAAALKQAQDAKVDGLLWVVVRSNQISLQVVSVNQKIVFNDTLKIVDAFSGAAKKDTIVNLVVESIASASPYRGFVTKVGSGAVKINIGSKQGLTTGTRLKAFDFVSPDGGFTSPTVTRGFLTVTKVGENASIARPTRPSVRLSEFTKVTFAKEDEQEHVLANGKKAWIGAGGEIINIEATAPPNYGDQSYTMSSSPAITVSGGYDVWSVQGLYTQASNTNYSLSYFEAQGGRELYKFAIFNSSLLTVRLGAAFTSLSVKVKSASTAIQGFNTLGPWLDALYEYPISGRIYLIGDLDAIYPMYATNRDFSQCLTSLGAGARGGARVDFDSNFSIEVGARFKYLYRAIDSYNGIQEQHTAFYVGAQMAL